MKSNMKTESIVLTGRIRYNEKFPPDNAKKGYVARILGTSSGAMKFNREFLGSEHQVIDGEQGLFEKQDGEKKGGFTRSYCCILSHAEYGLIIDSYVSEIEARKIAKLLDAGVDLSNAVEITELEPMNFRAKARTASQASRVAKSATIESAIESCWAILSLMPDDSKKKVMSQLKKRLTSNDSATTASKAAAT